MILVFITKVVFFNSFLSQVSRLVRDLSYSKVVSFSGSVIYITDCIRRGIHVSSPGQVKVVVQGVQIGWETLQ